MFYLGLDLGKLRDFAAFAAVEKEELVGWAPASASPVLKVRYLERAALGTPYTRVVERMGQLTRHSSLNGVSHLTVDATGVGVPVVESLRKAALGCRGITAVTITAGSHARQASGTGMGEHWNVPRTDLLAGLQVLLENGELKISKKMAEAGTLVRELMSMREGRESLNGHHDDLVMAVALACWQARRVRSGFGNQRLAGM